MAANHGHPFARGQRLRREPAWASLAGAGLLAFPAEAVTLGLTDSFSGDIVYRIAAVPEPASWAMFGLGGLALLTARRRRPVRLA